jgi:F-type H+-transporting ATPase subunit c
MKNRTIKFMMMVSSSLLVLLVSASAFAQGENAADALALTKASQGGWIALGAGLALGLAALGGAIGQGKAASAALDGIARNPGAADKVFTPFILALALIESLVIYALLIAFVLQGKI